MKILFIMEHRENAGSIHAVATYARLAERRGDTIAICGSAPPNVKGVLFTHQPSSFDRAIFLFESKLYRVPRVREAGILAEIPRRHRFVFDADGRYNPLTCLDHYDRNHISESERVQWFEHYHALSEQILQPTLGAPSERSARALRFYGFDPSRVIPAEQAPAKQFDVLHVGHNWWRWRDVAAEILPAFHAVRGELGAIAFAGLWWDAVPSWAYAIGCEEAFRCDADGFRRLGIRIEPPVPFQDVIPFMSTARINLFTQRPLLRHFEHLTQKYFEVFCADTIPLLMLDADYAARVYGEAGRELSVQGRVAEKLLDALGRPEHYRGLVQEVRQHLRAHHSCEERMRELLEVLSGSGR